MAGRRFFHLGQSRYFSRRLRHGGMTGNRFNRAELAGAFGDLGTLIPFVSAYVTLLNMDPCGILLAFGVAQILAGVYYRTPFPVQPMKAIGAIAITQAAQTATLGPSAVVGAGLVTGLIWLLLGLSGLAQRLAAVVPHTVVLGILLGLGMSFMLQGIRMMASHWLIASLLLSTTALLLSNPRFPAMFVLLLAGVGLALIQQPTLVGEMAAIRGSFRLPSLTVSSLTGQDLWRGLLFLALPQLPLTLGNALMAIVEENNRLFPDRPVSERKVAVSTGLLNLWSGVVGGVPMCHGAGGMAGHVQFGARTGGATIIMGILLTGMALFFSDAVQVLFHLFPSPVLGVILFFTGIPLVLGGYSTGLTTSERWVVLTTAACSIGNVGMAFLFGLLLHQGLSRGIIRL